MHIIHERISGIFHAHFSILLSLHAELYYNRIAYKIIKSITLY